MSEVLESEWYPSFYVDEIMPLGRVSANAWIMRIKGVPHLAGAEDDGEGAVLLTDGAIVSFTRCDSYGEVELTLTEDSHVFLEPPPVGYEQCCILNGWQGEAAANSIDEMIACLRESGGVAGDYIASFYTYSESMPHRFVAASCSFEPVAGRA